MGRVFFARDVARHLVMAPDRRPFSQMVDQQITESESPVNRMENDAEINTDGSAIIFRLSVFKEWSGCSVFKIDKIRLRTVFQCNGRNELIRSCGIGIYGCLGIIMSYSHQPYLDRCNNTYVVCSELLCQKR